MRTNTDVQLPLKIKNVNGNIIIRCVMTHSNGKGCRRDWKLVSGIDMINAQYLNEAITHVMEPVND